MVLLERFISDDQTHIAELKRQREICGWGYEDETINKWRADNDAGDKALFWIWLDSGNVQLADGQHEEYNFYPGIAPLPPNPNFQPVGHISLDWKDERGDETLASREDGTILITTFFILTSHQSKGIGGETMDLIEAKAASPEFGAKAITLNTMPAKDATSPAFWASLGLEYDPSKRVIEHWYARRGYITYKMEPVFRTRLPNGEDAMMDIVFMRKQLDQ